MAEKITFFVGYVVEYLDKPEEEGIGYEASRKLAFMPEPTKLFWEDDFKFVQMKDEPVTICIEIYGRLSIPEDVQDLLEWCNSNNYKLSAEEKSIIESGGAQEKGVLAVVRYDDGNISDILDADEASLEQLCFAATEDNIFTELGDKVKTAVAGSKVKKATKEGALEAKYKINLQQVQKAIDTGKFMKATMTEIEAAAYYLSLIEESQPGKEPEFYILYQDNSGRESKRDMMDIFNYVRGTDISAVQNAGSSAPAACADIAKIFRDTAADIARDKDVGVVGYTSDPNMKNAWLNSKVGSISRVTLSTANIKELSTRWEELRDDESTKKQMLETLLPETLHSAREVIKDVLSAQNRAPFGSWFWKLIISQANKGNDIPSEAVEYMFLQRYMLEGFGEIFNKFKPSSTDGLDLKLGSYAANAINLDVTSQLVLIYSAYSKGLELDELRKDGKWLPCREMNKKYKQLLTAATISRKPKDLSKKVATHNDEKLADTLKSALRDYDRKAYDLAGGEDGSIGNVLSTISQILGDTKKE